MNAPGRIGQQSSCFALHKHEAPSVSNPTMNMIQVDGSSKATIRQELHRVNINQFTTYYDLDYLSKEIIAGWGCTSVAPNVSSTFPCCTIKASQVAGCSTGTRRTWVDTSGNDPISMRSTLAAASS